MRRGTLSSAIAICASLVASAPASGATQTETFAYTGGPQTWTVPAGVTSASFQLTGASSLIFVLAGPPDSFVGGLAGRASATIPVTPGGSVQINVGERGDAAGGWNGGGDGAGQLGGSGGGGATDIRIGGTSLGDRVLVAGGGGGIGFCTSDPIPVLDGGDGGETGGDGQSGGCGGAGGGGAGASAGGTASAPAQPGSLGDGGDGATSASSRTTGGGGGGYYGGGGGLDGGAGGGGSSFGPAGTTFQSGVVAQDGFASVSYQDPSGPPTGPAATVSGATPIAEPPNCVPPRKKLIRQRARLTKASSEAKRLKIKANIRRTKKALRALGC